MALPYSMALPYRHKLKLKLWVQAARCSKTWASTRGSECYWGFNPNRGFWYLEDGGGSMAMEREGQRGKRGGGPKFVRRILTCAPEHQGPA